MKSMYQKTFFFFNYVTLMFSCLFNDFEDKVYVYIHKYINKTRSRESITEVYAEGLDDVLISL